MTIANTTLPITSTEIPDTLTCPDLKSLFIEQGILAPTDQKILDTFFHKHCESSKIESIGTFCQGGIGVSLQGKKLSLIPKLPLVSSLDPNEEINTFSISKGAPALFRQIDKTQIWMNHNPSKNLQINVGFTSSNEVLQSHPFPENFSHVFPENIFNAGLKVSVTCPDSQTERLFKKLIDLPSEKIKEWGDLSQDELARTINGEFTCNEGINPIAVLSAVGIALGVIFTASILTLAYNASQGHPNEKLKDKTWKYYATCTGLYSVLTVGSYMYLKYSDSIANKLAVRFLN